MKIVHKQVLLRKWDERGKKKRNTKQEAKKRNASFGFSLFQSDLLFCLEQNSQKQYTEASILLFQIFKFMSDLGGAMGMCIGASFITAMEFVELFVDFAVLMTARCSGNNLKNDLKRKSNAVHGTPKQEKSDILPNVQH